MKKLSTLSCVLLLAVALLAPGCNKKDDTSDKEQKPEAKVSAEETVKASEEKADVTSTPLDLQLGPLRDTTFDIKAGNAPNSVDFKWQFPEHKFFDVKTDKPSSLLDSPTGFLADKTFTPKTTKASEEEPNKASAEETAEASDEKTDEAPAEKAEQTPEEK
ncbi:MAG: hypothetical protein ISS77_01115 [Phycisphaerae bacterium]|nr:hypothetical protein [Phycisphaerae bacterium]